MATVVLSGMQHTIGERNSVTSVGWVNYSGSAGVAIPARGRGEHAHLIVSKNAAVNIGVWGYCTGWGNWARCDTVQMPLTNCAEAQMVRLMAAYDRVQTTVDGIGASGSANFFWAFSGE